jgi:hypothetical protein
MVLGVQEAFVQLDHAAGLEVEHLRRLQAERLLRRHLRSVARTRRLSGASRGSKMARMLVLGMLGVVAGALSFAMIVPPSRELVIKLGTLMDMAERADGERFRASVAPITPFVDGRFEHKRLTRVLKADLSAFGELCQRLQREARTLDRRAHVGMLPFGVYLLGAALWLAL